MPQPNLVPVRWATSRKTQSSGMSGSAVTVRRFPLTRIVYVATTSSRRVDCGAAAMWSEDAKMDAAWSTVNRARPGT